MRNLKRQLLAGPYILWMAGFILLPTLMILYYAFTTTSGNFSLLNISSITFSVHLKALILSLKLALACTLICLALSYPLAMILNNMKSKSQGLIVFIFILPMWMNFMLRILAWRLLLSNNGVINSLLDMIGLPGLDILNTPKAVVFCMVYDFLPFMILPIYSVIVKLDHSLLEAARDLGADSARVFRRVILPLSLPGVLSGVTMVFVPSVSTFAISRLLGGGTQMMLGDLIEQQFLGGAYDPHLGAAISMVMMVIVVLCMVVMNHFGEGEEQAVLL